MFYVPIVCVPTYTHRKINRSKYVFCYDYEVGYVLCVQGYSFFLSVNFTFKA